GALAEVATGDDPFDASRIVAFGPTGESLVVEVFRKNAMVWKELSLKDGSWASTTGRTAGTDVSRARLTHRLIGWVTVGDQPTSRFLEPALQERWEEVRRSFEGKHVRLVSFSDDGTRFVVKVEGWADGPSYELVDAAAQRVEHVGPAYADLPELSEV